jgi:hypothetical protein
MMAADPEEAEPFSVPLFGELAAQWADWQRGIPPSSDWKGRGAQNPRLLMAFAVLDRAKGRAERDRTTGAEPRSRWEREDPEVVEARVKDMLSRAGVI